MTYFTGVMVGLIFVASVFGLYAVNQIDPAESYSNTSEVEIMESSRIISEDQIGRLFNEIDNTLLSYFDELKKTLALFIISFFNLIIY